LKNPLLVGLRKRPSPATRNHFDACPEPSRRVQMIDVHLPTSDGREIVLTRYTQPQPELKLLINQLKLSLPPQQPPNIASADLRQPIRL